MRGNFSALLVVTPLALAAAPLLTRRRWSFVAGACLIIALALWLTVGADGAFVAATLGVVAWFWDQRNRLRALVIETESDESQDEGDEDGDEYFEENDEGDENEDINGDDEIDEDYATDEDDGSDRRERP
jgi:hypothetical protein